MKPSERIKEIRRNNKSVLMTQDQKIIDSIICYLDEEHQKAHPKFGSCINHPNSKADRSGFCEECREKMESI